MMKTAKRKTKKAAKHGKDERLVDLMFWTADGQVFRVDSVLDTPKSHRPEVSVGRTNSKYGLGFLIFDGHETTERFVLDREQVIVLRDFLHAQIGRMKSQRRIASRAVFNPFSGLLDVS